MKVHTQGHSKNPALLFFHAYPFCADMWRDQIHLFSEKFYCVAPDLPGFGQSKLPDHALTFEHYVDSVVQYLKEAKIEKAVFCGLSMGGYVALRLFERAPELCRALVLCDTKSAADGNEAKLKRAATVNLLMKSRSDFTEAQWKALIGESNKTNAPLKKLVEELVAKSSDQGIAAGAVAMATRTDTATVLPKIKVPTLIVVGEEDTVTPMSDAQALNTGIAGSRLVVLAKTGHLSNLESPQAFNENLAQFLESLS